MKRLSRVFFIYLFVLFPSVAATISNDKIGFTVTLPNNWVTVKTTDISMIFEDTTNKYQSEIAIYRESFAGNTLFLTPDEWTRARFVSYELTINADPLCALVFFDTISIKQGGTYWAPEAYTYYFDIDSTVGEWAEYIRFTAVGTSGYELYALGPQTDLDSNLTYYSGLIDGFQIRGSNPVIQPAPGRHLPRATSSKLSSDRLNLLGQRCSSSSKSSFAPQLIISQRKTSCRIR